MFVLIKFIPAFQFGPVSGQADWAIQRSVKLFPVPNSNDGYLAIYDHPLYEKKIYRVLHNTQEALTYKRNSEASLAINTPLEEMKIQQLLLLFKEERPNSLLFKYRPSFLLEFLETFGGFYPKKSHKKFFTMISFQE